MRLCASPARTAESDSRAGSEKSSKCDLCDGRPQCAGACPVGLFLSSRPGSITGHFHEDPLLNGSSLCVGCPAETTLRFVLRVMGKDTYLFGRPGCATNVINGMGTRTMVDIPSHMSNMTSVPSTMTGVKRYTGKWAKT